MLKKIMLVVTVVVLLAAVENLIAQDSSNRADARQTQRQRRGMGMQERGMRPGQGQFGMMQGRFGTWFDDLAKAYEKNDKEKMGQLIDDMKQRRERMQRGMGMAGPGGPPEGMGRRDRPTRPGGQGRGDRPMRPGQGRPMPGGTDAPDIESSPMPKTEAEKKILNILDDMDKNQRRGMMNVPIEDGRLLRLLTETVSAKHVVEIGTSNGYSSIWFCLALRKTGGKLTTHEIDARRASLARENFKRAGVDKLVTLIEGDAHKEVTKLKGAIDVVFIDADKEGYTDYLKKLLPLVRPGGLIIAHNISMRGGRSGIADYVKALTTNPDLETIFYGQGGGVSVTLKKR
ncbi:MAG: O-methyltransferase [Planctomycetota bacterium]|jgi:predicted O-methyltransferase YrrM